ncbi:MAG: dihydroorotase [Bacteroidetes bacterium]|nr:dihydroorotase [Bacteroidota bacterium]
MMQLLVKKATLLNPNGKFHLKKKDILIKNGCIEKIGDNLESKGSKIIDKKNTYVSAGWLDLFSDFCDPGFEHKEDMTSGSAAAIAGGFTDICLIPNTRPTTSSKSGIEYIKSKSKLVNLHPLGAISKDVEGKDLAEMYDMKMSGAIAFTDGLKPVQNSGLLLKALQYIKSFDGVIIQVPEDTSLAKHGLMHEGEVSTQLGMQGKPGIAESILIQRDISLLQYTDSKIHFTGISTKKSVDLIRQAKKQKLRVSCSVTPYHLLFIDEQLSDYNSMYKVNPPLRTEDDRQALLKGIEDGTIDCISSHHFPQDWDAKQVEFEYAQYGMIGLQTVLPMLLQASKTISIEKWISMLTDKPRAILSLPEIVIAEQTDACITIFNTDEKWMYNEQSNRSKSANSPLFGKSLQGKVLAVVNNKQVAIHE